MRQHPGGGWCCRETDRPREEEGSSELCDASIRAPNGPDCPFKKSAVTPGRRKVSPPKQGPREEEGPSGFVYLPVWAVFGGDGIREEEDAAAVSRRPREEDGSLKLCSLYAALAACRAIGRIMFRLRPNFSSSMSDRPDS